MSTNSNTYTPCLEPISVISRNPSGQEVKEDKLAQETPIAIVYNGISHAVMMASPQDLEDFAKGFSLTEGIVQSHNEILGIDIQQSEPGIEIHIELLASRFDKLKLRRRQLTGRTGCGLCGKESLETALPEVKPVPAASPPDYDTIALAVEHMHQAQTLQQECGAVHCAALIDNSGNVLQIREDVGRHNALDKLIGCLDRPLSKEEFIVMSSRASYELIIKAAIANCSTLVSISAPTALALQQSQKANMNLIGFIRGERQVIYHQSFITKEHKIAQT